VVATVHNIEIAYRIYRYTLWRIELSQCGLAPVAAVTYGLISIDSAIIKTVPTNKIIHSPTSGDGSNHPVRSDFADAVIILKGDSPYARRLLDFG
jgi:hypothetical protein